ncbi:MAG: hypothetical protein GY906_23680, partial [bacterium]|nr:hypothetical protein [bacterium]
PTQTLYLRQEGWSAPAKGSDERYPSESENLTRDARKTARGLVERALSGKTPPPVDVFPANWDDRGSDGEE